MRSFHFSSEFSCWISYYKSEALIKTWASDSIICFLFRQAFLGEVWEDLSSITWLLEILTQESSCFSSFSHLRFCNMGPEPYLSVCLNVSANRPPASLAILSCWSGHDSECFPFKSKTPTFPSTGYFPVWSVLVSQSFRPNCDQTQKHKDFANKIKCFPDQSHKSQTSLCQSGGSQQAPERFLIRLLFE